MVTVTGWGVDLRYNIQIPQQVLGDYVGVISANYIYIYIFFFRGNLNVAVCFIFWYKEWLILLLQVSSTSQTKMKLLK